MIPDKSKSWFYSINDSQVGPLTFEQLEEAANSGAFNRQTTKVWCEGLESWVLASSIEGLYSSPPSLLSDFSPVVSPDDYSLKFNHQERFKYTQRNSIFIGFIASSILFELIKLIRLLCYSTSLGDLDTFFRVATGFLMLVSTSIAGFHYYMIIFQQWKFISKYSNISSEGVIGVLFIPIHNFYWFFKIFAGYHEPFNLMVKENKLDKSFELDKSLGFTVAVISIPNSIYNFLSLSLLDSLSRIREIPLTSLRDYITLSIVLLTVWNVGYIAIISLYFLQVSRRINLVYAQIRANRA